MSELSALVFSMAGFTVGIMLATDSVIKGLIIGCFVPVGEVIVGWIIYAIDHHADNK